HCALVVDAWRVLYRYTMKAGMKAGRQCAFSFYITSSVCIRYPTMFFVIPLAGGGCVTFCFSFDNVYPDMFSLLRWRLTPFSRRAKVETFSPSDRIVVSY
ncbi:hypothetical protein, partial [Klebsiella pneumoniae]